jgi:hypothetical protein
MQKNLPLKEILIFYTRNPLTSSSSRCTRFKSRTPNTRFLTNWLRIIKFCRTMTNQNRTAFYLVKSAIFINGSFLKIWWNLSFKYSSKYRAGVTNLRPKPESNELWPFSLNFWQKMAQITGKLLNCGLGDAQVLFQIGSRLGRKIFWPGSHNFNFLKKSTKFNKSGRNFAKKENFRDKSAAEKVWISTWNFGNLTGGH